MQNYLWARSWWCLCIFYAHWSCKKTTCHSPKDLIHGITVIILSYVSNCNLSIHIPRRFTILYYTYQSNSFGCDWEKIHFFSTGVPFRGSASVTEICAIATYVRMRMKTRYGQCTIFRSFQIIRTFFQRCQSGWSSEIKLFINCMHIIPIKSF